MKILATDLDRTLLPNGKEKYDKKTYTTFPEILKKNNISLVYVSGRRETQIKQAIKKYSIPKPEFVISMVGTKIHEYKRGKFVEVTAWQDELAKQWKNVNPNTILEVLKDIPEIWPQGKASSNLFKQSYYANVKTKRSAIKQKITRRLTKKNISFSFTYSIDAARNIAQIDIMPPRANKNEALKFLLKVLKIKKTDVMTSGDTGNDLAMLLGGYKSTLVGNAKDVVKKEYQQLAKEKRLRKKIFVANENYAAGILEGLEYHKFI